MQGKKEVLKERELWLLWLDLLEVYLAALLQHCPQEHEMQELFAFHLSEHQSTKVQLNILPNAFAAKGIKV